MADRTATGSCSVREMGKGSNLFVTEGYSMAKGIGVGKYIASDEFTMGGCKWVLFFYPNGKSGKDNLGYLSVLLSLKSEAADLPMILEITLMDLSGKGKHKVSRRLVNSVPRTFRNGRKEWGCNRLFSRAALETTDFLRDDCLKIYCNMSVADHDERVMLAENMYSLHKDIFTGDFDPESWNDLVPKIPAPPEIMQDDEDEDEAGEEGALSKLGKQLAKLLLNPSNRLNDSIADDEDNDDGMEDDTYSVVVPKKEASKQEPFDNSPLKATSSAVGCGTPSASKSSKLKRKHRGQGSKALNSAPLKKAREENELKRVKDETASSSESGATPPIGPVTEDKIKAFLLGGGGGTITTNCIVDRFKSRLKLKEDRDAFAATLKRIAKIEKVNKRYYLVPREMI